MLIKSEDINLKELKDLIRGCLSKDRSSQKKIYEIYGSAMMGLCLRYCPKQGRSGRSSARMVFYRCIKISGSSSSVDLSKAGYAGSLDQLCLAKVPESIKNDCRELPLKDQDYFLSAGTDLADRLSEKELIARIQTLPPACRMVFNLYVF